MAKKKKNKQKHELKKGDGGEFSTRSARSNSNGREAIGPDPNRQAKEPGPGQIADTVILYCLYALVGLLPLAFFYPTYDIFELTKLTVLRLITLTMLGAWSWRIFRSRKITIVRTPLDWFVLFYLIVFSLATILSKNPRMSLLGDYGRFEGLLAIFNYGAIFLLTGSLIRKNDAIRDRAAFLRSLIFTAIATADIMSLYGVLQRFGLDFLVWSGAGTDLSRAFSTLGNPIYVAAYLTIILSMAIALFVAEQDLWPRVFLGASAALMFAALVFTFSRAGWAGFLVALVMLIALWAGLQGLHRLRGLRRDDETKKGNIAAVAILILVIIGVAAVSVTISSRVSSDATKSAIQRALSSFNMKSPGVAERLYLWKSAARMIKDKPVLGWGPEMFGTYYPKYRSEAFVRYEIDIIGRPKPLFQNRVHSDFLQTGVSSGVTGMLAYIGLWAGFFFFAIKRLLGVVARLEQAILIGIIAGLAGYLFQAQFSFSTIAVSGIIWALMAVTFLVGDDRGVPRNDTYSVSLDKISNSVFVVFVVLVFCAVLAGGFFSLRQIVADYYFDQGVTAMEAPDSYTAGIAFDTAIALNPYEQEYSNYAGNMFVEAAKASSDAGSATSALSTAINYLEEGIALNPDMPGYHYNLGNAEYYYSMLPGLDKSEAEKTMKEALQEYLIAVEADPLNIDAHLNLASAYMRFGRKEQAIAEIKEGLKINPNNAAAKDALKKLKESKEEKEE